MGARAELRSADSRCVLARSLWHRARRRQLCAIARRRRARLSLRGPRSAEWLARRDDSGQSGHASRDPQVARVPRDFTSLRVVARASGRCRRTRRSTNSAIVSPGAARRESSSKIASTDGDCRAVRPRWLSSATTAGRSRRSSGRQIGRGRAARTKPRRRRPNIRRTRVDAGCGTQSLNAVRTPPIACREDAFWRSARKVSRTAVG